MATFEQRLQRSDFVNEPLIDFDDPENRRAMVEALHGVRQQLGKEYSLVIDGEAIRSRETFASTNPSRTNEIIGIAQKGDVNAANLAIEAAFRAFEHWKNVSPPERAELLFRSAAILRSRSFEMAAWFASRWARLGGKRTLTSPRRSTLLSFMAGNYCVFPLVSNLCRCLEKRTTSTMAGVPKGVVNFITGPGGGVGEALVAHPKTRFIAFTGSKEAGLRINELAAQTSPGQIWIKRTILEMGGKNPIIVDDEADIKAAIDGVLISAFNYQGQKCSACSRAIVADSIYVEFLSGLVKRVVAIRVGAVDDPANTLGPVINASAKQSILQYIEIGKQEGRFLTGGTTESADGYFVRPTVIADVDSNARIAQEEIFGPVLAVIRSKSFEHALDLANHTEYGLTGGVYTRNTEKIRKACDLFHADNLFFNRRITGAMVGRHPFGGFNMSGTDSKAGGSDYVLLFLQAKTITRKLDA